MEQKNTVADKQTAERRKFHFDYPWLSAAVPLVVLMIVLPIANPRFLTVSNLTGVLVQAAVYVIMALGMSFVLMTGGILSTGFSGSSGCIYRRTSGIHYISDHRQPLGGSSCGPCQWHDHLLFENTAIHHDLEHDVSLPRTDTGHHSGQSYHHLRQKLSMDRQRQCCRDPCSGYYLHHRRRSRPVYPFLHGYRPLHSCGWF